MPAVVVVSDMLAASQLSVWLILFAAPPWACDRGTPFFYEVDTISRMMLNFVPPSQPMEST